MGLWNVCNGLQQGVLGVLMGPVTEHPLQGLGPSFLQMDGGHRCA